ncbi:hypothetical protein INT43_006039 [Umbelopsis isabellina]|uniref:Glycosyltransferase family 49 protein n=1 Tax=Mortierella isabellina TaxID=91625 RepID=A0A8H7PJ92_MORIS|nr:hypothetical protein INT43_006039 [Umbelopsis isabellina]
MSSDVPHSSLQPNGRKKGSHKRNSSTSTSITTNATSTHHRKPSYTSKNSSSYLNMPINFKSLDSIVQSPDEPQGYMPQLVLPSESSDDSPPQSSTPSKRERYQAYFQSYSRPSNTTNTHNSKPLTPLSTTPSLSFRLPTFLRYRWLRFLLFIYAIFSVCVTFIHLFQWSFNQWPEVSEDFAAVSNYSYMTEMSDTLKFSKLFSDQMPQNLENITPYFLRATRDPGEYDVTMLTVVTEQTADHLVDLAETWQGPVSAVLHIESTSHMPPDTTAFLFQMRHLHESNPSMRAHMDIHLIITPPRENTKFSLPMNQDRNLARLFARSEFIVYVDSDVMHISDLANTLASKREQYRDFLLKGDVLVIPSFIHITDEEEGIPQDKNTVVAMIEAGELALYDMHHDLNLGPTSLADWKESVTMYPVGNKYNYHYSPVAIMSRNIHPWCPERFVDNLASCFLGTQLSGASFWVLPDDYVIQSPILKEYQLSQAEIEREKLLYGRYIPEMCVHYARKLVSLDLWSSSRASRIKNWVGCHSSRKTWRSLTAP